MRRALIVITALAMIALTSCGGGTETAKPPQGSTASSPTSSSVLERGAVAGQPLHGIIRLTGTVIAGGGPYISMLVEGVNPTDGSTNGSRSFERSTEASMGIWFQDPGYEQRQWFSKDYSQVAATSVADSDGITYVGIVQAGTGAFTQLSKKPNGYGTLPSKTAGPFNPRTGRLWYAKNGGFGSIDPKVGPASERGERPSGGVFNSGETGALNDHFSFAPDGYGPLFNAGGTSQRDTLYLPNGTMVLRRTLGPEGYEFGPEGSLGADVTHPVKLLPDGVSGWPVQVIDNSSFLILGGPMGSDSANSLTQLYRVTIGAKRLSATPLLPDSNKKIIGVVVSPDHTQAAFATEHGLYLTSLLHRSEPRLLSSSTGALLEWLP